MYVGAFLTLFSIAVSAASLVFGWTGVPGLMLTCFIGTFLGFTLLIGWYAIAWFASL